MSGTVFKKKSSFKDDNDNDNNDDAKVRTVLPGTKERRAKNNDECAFLRVHYRHCNSWNLSGVREVLSCRRNPSKLSVSQAVGACGDDDSREMRMWLLKSYIIVHYDVQL